MTDDSRKRPSPPRPVSVRASLGKEDAAPSRSDPPERTFERGDERWIVRATGATRSGTGSDAGARLLFLTFASEEEPGTPLREVIVPTASLDDMGEWELEQALARSRPVSK